MSFDNIIKECIAIRKSKGMNQREFAIYCGTSKQNISKFESGNNNNLKLYLFYKELEGVDYVDTMD